MNVRTATTLFLLASLAGCGRATTDRNATIQLADPGPAAEIVNGEPVPQRLLDALARSRNWDLSKPEIRERALKELTNYVVAAQAARNGNLATDPDFEALVELGRLQSLSAATVAGFEKQAKPDDDAVRAEYEKQIGKSAVTDFDFTQIVFKDEAAARKAAGEISAGKAFQQVFDAHKKEALQTRAFTHVRTAQLPQALAAAIEALKPGETTKAPVRTPLGWHLVHLDGATPHAPPAFDQVKENLRRSMAKRAAEERLLKLRSEAKVTSADPAAPPSPATAAPAGGAKSGN